MADTPHSRTTQARDDVRRDTKGLRGYDQSAGGWDALGAVARAVRSQMDAVTGTQTLLRENKPDGFDCPGCAWPDPQHTSAFEFCENGAKAVTWEATKRRATPEVFAQHTVSELLTWHDHDIENLGRLTHPMAYDTGTDTYVAISWGEAFDRIAKVLNALPDPDMVEFYASGRASNEAAFLYQLFARAYGTNNFPDCSNMCHEATSVGLAEALGLGKASVSLDDFDHADAILSIGHNPGTNHPRMMATLRNASKRGAPIVVFNPMKERALERFTSPQDPVEMVTMSSTPIASTYLQLKVGGDIAALKGVMKALLEKDAADLVAGGPGLLDREFIAQHTTGFEALAADLGDTDWIDIEMVSGLSRADLEQAADIYARAGSVICCYGMGVTQHSHGTGTVQQISNLLLLRGNIGKRGAGICPLRGHSNVQGDRTVGIDEKTPLHLRTNIKKVFGFDVPEGIGHNAVEAMAAMADGRSKVLIALGGNLAVAMPDMTTCFKAMRNLDLMVNIATKPNRSHLLFGKETLLLPCLGRTERDVQASGEQAVTVEDTVSMVHASRGKLAPPSDQVRSEPWIVARMAKAVLGDKYGIDWSAFADDYDRIRDAIEQVIPGFDNYNERIKTPGGFRLPVATAERTWKTASGKADFKVHDGLAAPADIAADTVTLTTIRSHDQFNTTIYGHDDRYRGVFGRRDVVFMNQADMAQRGLVTGDRVDVESLSSGEVLRDFAVFTHDIASGCAAAYYPEANVLIPLSAHDRKSGTPAYKSVPVRIRKAAREFGNG